MRTALAALVFASAIAEPATADVLYKNFDANREKPSYIGYVEGVARGISWMNAWAATEGKRVYCTPPDRALTNEQIIDILDRHVQKQGRTARDDYIELLLINALRSLFPCPTD